MDNLRDMLAARASAVIPGRGYNAFRGQHQDGDGWQGAPLHFEDVLSAIEPERSLVDRIVPSLVRFLQRKKQDPENPRNVLVALFLGESCFILPAEALLDLFCEIEGTARQALHFRVLGWLV
jgi:hypothetical protein